MGHSRKDKADSHDRIVGVAARSFREHGVDGVGVAELMKEAEMTHGGFYRHFESRDDLVAEGVERALLDGARGAFEAEAAGRLRGRALLFALVDWYLGTAHRDTLATSCAVTSLAGDVSRGSERTRAAYTRQLTEYLDLFVRLMVGDVDAATKATKATKAKRAQAVAAWATLVGAVSLARAVDDDALSREILKTAGAQIKRQIVQLSTPPVHA